MLRRNCFYIQKQKTFIEELFPVMEILQKERVSTSIVGLTLFINASGETDFFQKRNLIREMFRILFGKLPVNVVSQPAGNGIALEIWMNHSCKKLKYKAYGQVNYTVYEDSWGKFVGGFGLSANDVSLPFKEQTAYAFETMQAILSAENLTMDHLVRQWNYLPQILKMEVENQRLYQHYQLFNDIRQQYYATCKKTDKYPAATGIGMDYGTVTIDFFAEQTKRNCRIAELNNPHQTAAFHYGQEVLVGSPLSEGEIRKAPLFERAKYIGSPDKALLFISGTAAIIGEETQGLNDVSEQTAITIKNISGLISKENRLQAKLTAPLSFPKQSLPVSPAYLRVYIKNADANDAVMNICQKQYGNIPVLYVKADICRDNLLVEIEGEAIVVTTNCE
jgi:enamine deaminase RidA (YjgF/YER057c/UK114 family)